MTISAMLPAGAKVQAWLRKAPHIALVLAMVACGPLLSFDQVQHHASDVDALNTLQAGINPWKITAGAVATVAGFAGMVYGGGKFVTGFFGSMSSGMLTFNFVLGIVSLAVMTIGLILLAKTVFGDRKKGDDHDRRSGEKRHQPGLAIAAHQLHTHYDQQR